MTPGVCWEGQNAIPVDSVRQNFASTPPRPNHAFHAFLATYTTGTLQAKFAGHVPLLSELGARAAHTRLRIRTPSVGLSQLNSTPPHTDSGAPLAPCRIDPTHFKIERGSF